MSEIKKKIDRTKSSVADNAIRFYLRNGETVEITPKDGNWTYQDFLSHLFIAFPDLEKGEFGNPEVEYCERYFPATPTDDIDRNAKVRGAARKIYLVFDKDSIYPLAAIGYIAYHTIFAADLQTRDYWQHIDETADYDF